MKRLLVAAMLLAIGVGAAQAADAGGQPGARGYQCSQPAEPGVWGSSDASYGKQLASQYNTANGE